MKNTHEVKDIENLILEKLDILKNGETTKEKREARRAIINLEKFYNDIQGKKINGKKYPTKEVPPKTTKKELLDLIDSVGEHPEGDEFGRYMDEGFDLSGVSVGKNRFEFIE